MTWSGASAVALAAALLAAAPARAASCNKDSDCSSGNKCRLGACVEKSDRDSGPALSAGGSATASAPGPNQRPSIAILALYSWGGVGIGARVEWPIVLNVLKEIPWKNDIFIVGGLEYYAQSYVFVNSYRWNYVRIDAGAMWNFWFLDNFAAYPKLTLGYDAAWISGWDNANGPTPTSGGTSRPRPASSTT